CVSLFRQPAFHAEPVHIVTQGTFGIVRLCASPVSCVPFKMERRKSYKKNTMLSGKLSQERCESAPIGQIAASGDSTGPRCGKFFRAQVGRRPCSEAAA